jgi:hypothetical protein
MELSRLSCMEWVFVHSPRDRVLTHQKVTVLELASNVANHSSNARLAAVKSRYLRRCAVKRLHPRSGGHARWSCSGQPARWRRARLVTRSIENFEPRPSSITRPNYFQPKAHAQPSLCNLPRSCSRRSASTSDTTGVGSQRLDAPSSSAAL